MSRILLVDDNPHALRMGERILSEEGHEVVALGNAESALIRLEDVDPDVVIADAEMPVRTGYEICQYLKMNPRHRHARVILTCGSVEQIDGERYQRAGADGELKKPFEASALIAAVQPLAAAAAADRAESRPGAVSAAGRPPSSAPFVAVIDAAEVRAAVTVALDAAMESLAEELSSRVIEALRKRQPATPSAPPQEYPKAQTPAPTPPPAAAPEIAAEEKRPRFKPSFGKRTGSILGLSLDAEEPEGHGAGPGSHGKEE